LKTFDRLAQSDEGRTKAGLRLLKHPFIWLSLLCAACNGPRGDDLSAAETRCSVRIIASFERAFDAALLESLSRASGAQLSLLNEMPAGLYLLELAANGPDDACSRALERLRSDECVRSADMDERRGIAD